MAGDVSFVEIGPKDSAVSRTFFERVFGWSFNPMGAAGGWFQTPSIKMGLHGSDPQPQLYVFFDVADLDAAIALVRASGGQADPPGQEQPGFGRFSNCQDPQGIRFGLHQKPS